MAAGRDFLRDNVLEGEERGPGRCLSWLPLCDRHGTMMCTHLAEAVPESEGGGFFFILIEPLGLSGWVPLSEGSFWLGRGKVSLGERERQSVCVGGGGRRLSPSVQLGRCLPKLLRVGFEVGGRKHPWVLELWPFHYLQFLSTTWLYFLVSRGLDQMLRSLPAGRWWGIVMPFCGGARHQTGLLTGHCLICRGLSEPWN